jgi:hypothetical protein
MYDTLLFLHVLAAFSFVAATVMTSAFVLGSPVDRSTRLLSSILWGIGGLGTLVFGVWLAIYVKGYEVWDGWIIAAFVLWVLANGAGQSADSAIGKAMSGDGGAVSLSRRAVFSHWARVLWVVLLLVVMIWKPGA